MKKVDKGVAELWYDKGIHIPSRTLRMDSEVNEFTHSDMLSGLHLLNEPEKSINIFLHNYGGNWYDGMGIYDAIRLCESPIYIKVVGVAMSMGSIILQAGDHRLMTSNSRMMLHYGEDCIPPMHAKDVQREGQENKFVNEKMEEIYLKRIKEKNPRYKKTELEKLLRYNKYLSATEALDLGLIDEVIEVD